MPLAIEVAFVLLSVATVTDWLTHRERRRGYLALAFGSLTLLVLLAPSLSQPGVYGQLLTTVGIVLFLLSGWALLMFRDSFMPLGAGTKRLVAVIIVLVAAFAIFVQLTTDIGLPHAPLQTFALAALRTPWASCGGEPCLSLR